ncbi:MAG: DUF3572 family protein [Parasphingopyxis sp.]|uniref:DUF3572 family protein n=1 Tax=Parasphingopyxis sp. TaxID=1920299 RepID=UPI003FA12E63
MTRSDTNADGDSAALALRALAWTLSEEDRAQRLLALTGLTADHLRGALGEPATLAAILRFLEAHEPDLLACAEAIGSPPETLVMARRELET